MPFVGVPAAHQLGRLKPGVVLQPYGIERIIADMHRPQPPQAALGEGLCYGVGQERQL